MFTTPTQALYRQASATPTVSAASAYTAGDQVGGIMIFQSLLLSGKCGQILHASVLDKANQSAVLNLFLFSSLPAVASTDNAALSITAAEMAKCCAVITFVAAGYISATTPSFTSEFNQGNIYAPPFVTSDDSTGTIWGVMKTTGTPTYASTSDLVVTLGATLYTRET